MKYKRMLIIVSLFLLTNCTSTKSQNFNNWKLLGEKQADFGLDSDVMLVNSKPTFNKIKVRVYNGTVIMKDMKVEFLNGDVVDVSLRDVFEDGGYSREIQLDHTRHIAKIYFRYKTAKNAFEKGIVQVWGSM